jgi:hypothetical protein
MSKETLWDKAALPGGAAETQKPQAEAKAMAGKLNGTIDSVIKEITRLHGAILSAARTSLSNAIRIGELLSRVRGSRRGKWLLWIKQNAPFSERTARRYVQCYEKRKVLESANVADLSDAYALLCAPTKAAGHTTDLGEPFPHNGIVADTNQNLPSDDSKVHTVEEPAKTQVTADAGRSKKRKSQGQLMRAIGPEYLNAELRQSQMEIDKRLSDIIAQIARQDHTEWMEFPERLEAHAANLTRHSHRLVTKTP